jgi:hypothetical protein
MTWSIVAAIRSSLNRVRCTSTAAASLTWCASPNQRRLQHGRHPGILARHRYRLIGHQLRLHDHPHGLVDGLHLVADRRHRPLREREQPPRPHPHRSASRRHPLHIPAQHPRAQVQHTLVPAQLPVPHIQRLVVDHQPDQLAVGHIHHGLPRLRVPEPRLRVRQRPQLVERVQVRARQCVRLTLIQVRPQSDVAIGQREHRLRLGQPRQVQYGLTHLPQLHGVRRSDAHLWVHQPSTPTSSLNRRHVGALRGASSNTKPTAASEPMTLDAQSRLSTPNGGHLVPKYALHELRRSLTRPEPRMR